MSLLPLHRDKEHKFKNGQWVWDEHEAKLKFHSHEAAFDGDKRTKSRFADAGLKFGTTIDVGEEKIFRETFLRPNTFYDSDVVTVQDIKNLVLFTLKTKVTPKFIEMVHDETFDKFLHSIIFYTDLFLMTLEYLLIRRDKALSGQVRDMLSVKVEQFMAKQLSDRRLLIAREYSKILLMCSSKVSPSSKFPTRPSAVKDLHFFESLIDFTIQCTFIALHRRAFNAISCELNRLCRTEFFNVARKTSCRYRFSFRERQTLYGHKWHINSQKNFRSQMSPLMAELLILTEPIDEVLKIGEEKYLGANKYLLNLELEFTVPECHLQLIGRRRGILGHPKYLYDTMLNLNEPAVVKENFSDDYDPFSLMKRTFISIHTSDDFDERRKNLPTRLIIHREAYGGMEKQLRLWKRKESIIGRISKKSVMD